MGRATLTINSRNYGSWSLRGWLLCSMSGIDFDVEVLPSDDPSNRAELLLLSPSFQVPRLSHDGITVWDTLAIAEYLHEHFPDSGLFPKDPGERAWCRSVCGEMHSGFSNLRSALPMNLQSRHRDFKIWGGAKSDIERIEAIWRDCLEASGGPYLFGREPNAADAMYAPVCARFLTYDVKLDDRCAAYRDAIMALPAVVEWVALAEEEPDHLEELDAEF
jgi:glutathione S-transferase